MQSENVDLAADGVAANTHADLLTSCMPGPPFPITFRLTHGDTWPAVELDVLLGDHVLTAITTTEPRLKEALRAVLDELS